MCWNSTMLLHMGEVCLQIQHNGPYEYTMHLYTGDTYTWIFANSSQTLWNLIGSGLGTPSQLWMLSCMQYARQHWSPPSSITPCLRSLPEKATTVPGLYSSWTLSVRICKKQLSYLSMVARSYQSDWDWGSQCNGVCRFDIIDRFVYTIDQCSSASCMAGLFSLDHASSFSLTCRPAA